MRIYHLLATSIVALSCFSLVSCGNSNNSSSSSEEQALNSTETINAEGNDAENNDVEEEQTEPELLENSFSFVYQDRIFQLSYKAIIRFINSKKPDRTGRFDEYFKRNFSIKMNFDDGSASAICISDIAAEDDLGKYVLTIDTSYYDGSWKLRSVERGSKYIDAYEFHLSLQSSTGKDFIQHYIKSEYNPISQPNETDNYTILFGGGVPTTELSFYTTEKLDVVYVGWGEDKDMEAYYDFQDGKKSSSIELFDVKHTWK